MPRSRAREGIKGASSPRLSGWIERGCLLDNADHAPRPGFDDDGPPPDDGRSKAWVVWNLTELDGRRKVNTFANLEADRRLDRPHMLSGHVLANHSLVFRRDDNPLCDSGRCECDESKCADCNSFDGVLRFACALATTPLLMKLLRLAGVGAASPDLPRLSGNPELHILLLHCWWCDLLLVPL